MTDLLASPQQLATRLAEAIAWRAPLLERLRDEGTDALRLLHGATEGAPGLTVDRYGPLLLVQTFREPLGGPHVLDALTDAARHTLGDDAPPFTVYNHRGDGLNDAIDWHQPEPPALAPHSAHELGLAYRIQARHRGKDPWLFLDLRAARRRVRQLARDATVLNLFAYTCGVGLCAAAGGAAEVVNVDFALSALRVGKDNLAANNLDDGRSRFVHADFIPYVRQLAGLPLKGRARLLRDVRKVDPRAFDLVILDPPKWATSPFGAIDLVRDYPSLLKPTLLATKPGGTLICTNNVAAVSFEEWKRIVMRTAEKVERPIRRLERILPDPDFPSPDAAPPLKILVLEV